MFRRVAWLSLTPEPERVLPAAIATLATGSRPTCECVRSERARIEGLILNGSERDWLAYLEEARRLIERSAAASDENDAVADAQARATAVIANHHNLLLGLPGDAARRTARERVILAELAGRIPINRTSKDSA
jgi:hypothetical protein